MSDVARIHHLLERELSIRLEAPDTDLIESGLIDSLGLIELLAALEQEFQVALDQEELDVDDFRTVERIAALVGRSNSRGRDA
jgi:acyl carrier protein